MFTKFIIASAIVNVIAMFALWGTANATELTPGRCVTILEPGKAPRTVCNVPKSEQVRGGK
jgi:hypothetical protein